MAPNNREERALLARLEKMGVTAPTYRNGAGLSLWMVDTLPSLRPDDPDLSETVEMARALLARDGWVNITLTENIELLSVSDQEQMLRDLLQEIGVLRSEPVPKITDLMDWTISELPRAPNDALTHVAVRLAKLLTRRRRPATKRHSRT